MFFQKKNSKKVKDSDGSQKKDKDSRGKNDFFDRAKGGFGALAGSLKSAKNDAEERAEKLHEDVKTGIETILHKGSGFLEKAKEESGDHSDASHSTELEQGSEEQGKDMEAISSVIDKVKSHRPEVMEKVKEEVMSLAEVLHIGKHESKGKEPETEEKVKEGETATQNADESPSILEQAVHEIQDVVAAVQQQQTARAETEAPTEAAAETSAEGERPDQAKPEVEKDDPTKRVGFLGFFAMLFERLCSPADKKKD